MLLSPWLPMSMIDSQFFLIHLTDILPGVPLVCQLYDQDVTFHAWLHPHLQSSEQYIKTPTFLLVASYGRSPRAKMTEPFLHIRVSPAASSTKQGSLMVSPSLTITVLVLEMNSGVRTISSWRGVWEHIGIRGSLVTYLDTLPYFLRNMRGINLIELIFHHWSLMLWTKYIEFMPFEIHLMIFVFTSKNLSPSSSTSTRQLQV